MKVGILTFHRANNYGAVLQAYALQHTLEQHGVEAEILDYRCEHIERQYRVWQLRKRDLPGLASAAVHVPWRYARHVRFESFRRDHLQLSRSFNPSEAGDITEGYDRIIVGSDQVWNLALTGGDTTYFLDFCDDDSKKVAYAASTGRDESLGEWDAVFGRYLSGFRSLSVREQETQVYLARLLRRPVEWTVDPVFLIPRDSWDALAIDVAAEDAFIFGFCLREPKTYERLDQLRRESGLPVVYVPDRMRSPILGKRVFAPRVEELLGYIRSAKYIVTDSFHVMAFAIIFQRQFAVQLNTVNNESNNRITSLLSFLGLSRCALRCEEVLGDVLHDWNHVTTTERLAERVRASLRFLSGSIGLD